MESAMRNLIFWTIYYSPSLIGWYRARHGKPPVSSLKYLFLFNTLTGWTGVCWIFALSDAFGKNLIAWCAFKLVKILPAGGAGNAPQAVASSSSGSSPCSQCQGSGTTPCSSCGGRGSWYDAPHGESGTAQLMTCGACTSSGRLRCPYCGGSGHAAALI